MAWADYATAHGTVGKLEMQLVTKTLEPVGTVQVWNRAVDLNVIVTPDPTRCVMSKVYVYLDTEPAPPLPVLDDLLKLNPVPTLPGTTTPLPLNADGTINATLLDEPTIDALMNLLIVEADYGEWPYSAKYKTPTSVPYVLNVPLSDLEGLEWGAWGEPWLEQRLVTVAVMVELKTLDVVPVTFTAWALNVNPNVPIEIQRTAWDDNAFAPRYELQHPKHGNFAGPVHGMGYVTPTHTGVTGPESGGFSFYPGEDIKLGIGGVYIGTAKADQQISPQDVFPSLEVTDAAVLNLTRLVLSMDGDGNASGAIDITASAALLPKAMGQLGINEFDFANTVQMDQLIAKIVELGIAAGLPLANVPAVQASTWLETTVGNSLLRRNVSRPHGELRYPPFMTDKPKMEIMPIWMPAKTANGAPTVVEYKDSSGKLIETRDKVKPLVVTYMQERDPAPVWGQRRASDIFTAVSMDDGATWKKFNVSRMAWHSSFTLKATGEKFPGDCRSPQLKVATTKLLVVWTSAYARGGKPAVSIKTTDDYKFDDEYAVKDVWGVRGTQGSVDYNLDPDVGDQGIGEIPYYALWACRGVLVWDGNASQYPGREIGDIVWFKPERLTTGRRDAFIPVVGAAKDFGYGIAWQEDPGGLRPGQCMAGGHGWSGATVHKKTDIWYSFIKWGDFEAIDDNWVPMAHADEHGEESHSLDGMDHPEDKEGVINRPKWLVPMSLPVRVSDNNTVNTDNMKVQLDATGMPIVENGNFVPILGAEEEDWVRHEHEHDGECGQGDGTVTTEDEEHDGEGGTGGGWGMARYAYMHPTLPPLADMSGANIVWDGTLRGEFQPVQGQLEGCRWYRFINQPGMVKIVAVTPDGRVLDGDTGACRPNLNIMPGGWAILGYEETKGLGQPPEGEDHHETDLTEEVAILGGDGDDTEPHEKGKNVIYHSFKFDQPDMVSAGNVVNLPALDATGDLIPVYYKDADGNDTSVLNQYATENARRVRFIVQSKSEMGTSRTPLVVLYKQGVEGNGKPSDIFAVRVVVPKDDSGNPYRFSNFQRYGSGATTADPSVMRYQRRHMNMSSVTVEAIDPMDLAVDHEGNYFGKVSRWNQNAGNLTDESSANPYSDAKGHRGFITGDNLVIGYSFTPNWGRKGGDHSDFYVRRSFDGGVSFKTHPKTGAEHTVIRRDPFMRGVYYEEKQFYAANSDEPARNVSLLKGNTRTVGDPRLVEPMGKFVVNEFDGPAAPLRTADDSPADGVYYIAYGTQEVLHGQVGSPFEPDLIPEDIYYTRTTDGGTTWLQVPWVINPDSSSPDAGETVYRFPWLAHGSPYQGHAQLKMHPNGSRLYAIWHQWTDEYSEHVSPHDNGNDIWFRRIDFMEAP
jgi:hypothetical protein